METQIMIVLLGIMCIMYQGNTCILNKAHPHAPNHGALNKTLPSMMLFVTLVIIALSLYKKQLAVVYDCGNSDKIFSIQNIMKCAYTCRKMLIVSCEIHAVLRECIDIIMSSLSLLLNCQISTMLKIYYPMNFEVSYTKFVMVMMIQHNVIASKKHVKSLLAIKNVIFHVKIETVIKKQQHTCMLKIIVYIPIYSIPFVTAWLIRKLNETQNFVQESKDLSKVDTKINKVKARSMRTSQQTGKTDKTDKHNLFYVLLQNRNISLKLLQDS